MAPDVYMLIADPAMGAIAASHWIGRSGVRDRVGEVLQRAPDHERIGYLAWGGVTADELTRICEAHHDGGLTPIEVERLAVDFPCDRFWWAIWIDY